MMDAKTGKTEEALRKLCDDYPKIVWRHEDCRVVRESPLGFVPERQLSDDAMGKPAWEQIGWEAENGKAHPFVGLFLADLLSQIPTLEISHANLDAKTG